MDRTKEEKIAAREALSELEQRLRAAGASIIGGYLWRAQNRVAEDEVCQSISVTPRNRTWCVISAVSDEDEELKIIRVEFNMRMHKV